LYNAISIQSNKIGVTKMTSERIQQLEKQIADLKNRWPSHSVPPAMMAQLDELEEELNHAIEQRDREAKRGEITSPEIHLHAIGYVENDFTAPGALRDCSALESRLVVAPSLVEGLQGLEAGQQLMVLFYFHRSQGYELSQHPCGDSNRPKRGVFTLRSPHRPNPIGVTVVELLAVDGNVLHVRGLDACNGTPILDLKLE
jgi:tRNA-Thr(GGU) m(6)t(6)A37 methyltransferase TsaA